MSGCPVNAAMVSAAAILVIAASGTSAGQELREPRLVAQSEMVLVPTVVTDREHRLIRDLKADNFALRVDRSDMPVAGFWREQEPVSTVIVFDASGSMKPVLAHSQEAVDAFLELAHADDEYALVVCRERPTVAVPLTKDSSRIRAAASLTAAKGATPLYDSLALAMELARGGQHRRKVILVVSDGADTCSHTSFRKIRSLALETESSIYSVQFWSGQGEDDFLHRQLADLANLTGGMHFENVSEKRLARLFMKLDVHERYILAFQPHRQIHDGKWHTIGVKLRDVDIGRPLVFWRHGYADRPFDAVQ